MTNAPALSDLFKLADLPVSLVAQCGDVFIFQTRALAEQADDQSASLLDSALTKRCQQSTDASYGTLNLGLHVKDSAKQVLNNRMRLLAGINSDLLSQNYLAIKSLHWVNQVHGNKVHRINSKALGMQTANADAMISEQGRVGLAIMTADCVPIVLYQSATHQIAAIHAGWQGLACGVIQATAKKFANHSPISAWIGVCISQQNYEVGMPTAEKLRAGCQNNQLLEVSELADFMTLYTQPSNNQSDKNYLGLENANRASQSSDLHNSIDKLSNCATLSENKKSPDKIKLNLSAVAKAQLKKLAIDVAYDSSDNCSYADRNYYSYRRQTHLQQPATGRMALIIVRASQVQP